MILLKKDVKHYNYCAIKFVCVVVRSSIVKTVFSSYLENEK